MLLVKCCGCEDVAGLTMRSSSTPQTETAAERQRDRQTELPTRLQCISNSEVSMSLPASFPLPSLCLHYTSHTLERGPARLSDKPCDLREIINVSEFCPRSCVLRLPTLIIAMSHLWTPTQARRSVLVLHLSLHTNL